jgi:Cdc6-like AAA superfamily ATPase
MFGLVNAKVISKGRYGRTREISINLSKKLMERLEEILCKEFA